MAMMTKTGRSTELDGRGEVWYPDGSMLTDVAYHLDVSADGTVTGILRAPASRSFSTPPGRTDSLPLLRIPAGRLIAFEIRAYERRPGGAAHISGCLLPTAVESSSPWAGVSPAA